jgi:hypothetical protein
VSEAKLRIKLLGVFAVEAATDLLLVDIDGHVPVHELITQVREQWPSLAHHLPDLNEPDAHLSVMVIINKTIATADSLVGSDDQVTIVSPLGGG